MILGEKMSSWGAILLALAVIGFWPAAAVVIDLLDRPFQRRMASGLAVTEKYRADQRRARERNGA